MDFKLFKESLSGSEPPRDANPYLKALWYEGKGDWDQAHRIVQDIEDAKAAWVHAYLHRREGDIFNADYWYRRAGKLRPSISLEAEWQQLASALID